MLAEHVTDVKNNTDRVYDSIGSAARKLGLRQAAISLYLKDKNKGKRKNPYKNRYLFYIVKA